jgi:hypothetical protein
MLESAPDRPVPFQTELASGGSARACPIRPGPCMVELDIADAKPLADAAGR